MNEDGGHEIDFSCLDPSRDAARWERMIAAVASRARAARGRGVADQLAAWWRPALAAAAVLAVAFLGAALLSDAPKAEPRASIPERDAALVRWALGDGRTSAWDDLALLGGFHDEPR